MGNQNTGAVTTVNPSANLNANPNNIKSRLIDTANIYRASYKRIVGIILNVLARNYPCLVTGICNKIQSYTVELIHNDR